MSALARWVKHAERYGTVGLMEAAASDLTEAECERLRAKLLDRGLPIPNRPRKPNDDGAKALQNRPAGPDGPNGLDDTADGRICATCGRGLVCRYSNAQTCSPRCRVALHRARKRSVKS